MDRKLIRAAKRLALMRSRARSSAASQCILVMLAVIPLLALLAAPSPAYPQAGADQLIPLNYTRIEETVKLFASFGSRMTGYPGYYKALNYIYSCLRGLGLKVINHTYKVLVPIEEEVYVEALKPFHIRVKAYALYPNGVNPSPTPPEGFVGPLYYVGRGDLPEFDGKDVKDSIVAMEFNSQDNWLNAAKLGAKAVIFIEPNDTTYYECDKKFLETPLYFPRLYIRRSDWELIKNATLVRVVSRVSWKEIEATNLIAVVNGSSPNDVVVLTAHFDSWSVVPGMARSKAEAIAPALLLEYARYLKDHPPKYTVWIVFLSGHWQALAGAREFVEDFFFSDDVLSGRITIWGLINLDMFASDGDGLQLLHASYYTTYGGNSIHGGGFPSRLAWFMSTVKEILVEDRVKAYASKVLGVENPAGLVSTFFTVTGFWGTEPIPYMLDSEAASISGVPAFSIVSRHSGRLYVGIPVDDGRYADISKLRPYLDLAVYIVDRLLNMEWPLSRSDVMPTRYELAAQRGYPGFTTFYGRVVVYNFTKGWYDPVPNAIVEARLITSTYKLNKIIVKADEHGRFVIHGIPHAGRGEYGGTVIPFSRWVLRGWVLDDEGNILMATDLGQFGMQNFPQMIIVLHPYENVTVVVMKAVTVELFDVNLPTTVVTPCLIDPRTSYFDWWKQVPVILQPYDLLSKSIPLSYGFYYNGWEKVALVWTQPNITFTVVGYYGMGEKAAMTPFLLITNSTADNTEGYGIRGRWGERIRILFTAYQIANDLYYVSYGRYRHFVERHVGSPSADKTLEKAKEYLEKAWKAYREKRYSDAYAYALVARAYAFKAYDSEVMPLVNDAARSMLFMFPLVVFAGFFLEKITLHSEGVKRLVFIAIISGIFLWIFSLIHPAFAVLSNISLGMMGALIMIILLLTVLILGAEGEAVRSRIERRVLGVHKAEVSRMDTAITAFSVGSEYIRRRPLRAALMLITLLTMTIAITSFTSLMPARVTLPVARHGYHPVFDEILIKMGRGVPPNLLSDDLVNVVRVIAGPGYEVLPRAWVYPPVDRALMATAFRVTSEAGKNGTVYALLGITPREYELLYAKLTTGLGIRFEDANHAVITRTLAQNLSVTLGDKIYVMGQEFVVTGIIDAPEVVDKMIEADGYNPMPADPTFYQLLAKDLAVSYQAGAAPPNLGVSRTIIIPYRRALELNGYVASICLLPKEEVALEDLFNTVKELAFALDVTTWFSQGGAPYVSSTFTSLAVGGWEMVMAVLVIGALNVATMVLGSLKERTREIYVFSAIGLSPLGVTVFFIAEVLVYVTVGVVLGYLLGYGVTQLMVFAGALPSTHVFNFASAFTIIGTLTIIAASLAAVIYPSYVAARIITPSLERRWRPGTKPRGDEWEIPLPMSVPSDTEARGVLSYLYEYYSGAGAAKEGVHVVRELSEPDYEAMRLTMTVALAPVEAGVNQRVEIMAILDRSINRYVFLAHLRRLSGPSRTWVDSNYRFIDDLRKQLLMWSSLPSQERKKYLRRAGG